MNINPEISIEDKIAKLETLKIELKKEFVSLNEVIDKVVESMTPWYLFRESFTLPYPVCIWGPTGTGKTKMVKRICHFLELPHHYTDMKGFLHSGYEAYSTSKTKVVKIWDEYHNAFTKFPSGAVNFENKQKLNSLASFLSEGYFVSSKKEDDKIIWSEIARKIFLTIHQNKENKTIGESAELVLKSLPSSFDGIEIREEIQALLSKEETVLQGLCGLRAADVAKQYNSGAAPLIFILGNLDPLFDNIIDNYSDSFKIKEKILAQTNQDIIESLDQLFFPEEISRLGTNHILFPVLTNKEYQEIINRKMNQTKSLFAPHNIKLNFGENFLKTIYETIINPKYGARILDSSYRSMFEAPILTNLHKLRNQEVYIDFKMNNQILLSTKDFEIEIPFLSAKKKEITPESLYQISIHEAGHVLVHFLLTKELPEFVTSNIKSASLGGLAKFKSKENQLTSKTDLSNHIKRCLGGIISEKLVFGDERIASGSYSDLRKATAIAENMVTKYGLGKNLSHIEINSSVSKSLYSFSKEIDLEIKEIIDNAQIQVESLLTENKELLIKLGKLIESKDKVYEKDLIGILK
jgi:hypothetical protein